MRGSFSGNLRRILRRFDIQKQALRCGYLGGFFMLLSFVLIRMLSGTPYRVYFYLREVGDLLPLGIYAAMNLLFSVWLGIAFGMVFSCRSCCGRRRAEVYRGGMLFIFMTVLWYAAYPLVVRGNLLLLALICLIAVCVIGIGCVVSFFRILPISGWIVFLYLIWLGVLIFTLLHCLLG